MQAPVKYQTLYNKYKDDTTVLKTESYAKWSLPTIFADTELRDGKRVPVQRDFQSIGAILTNHLSSKLAQLLFPANQPFFRLDGGKDADMIAKAASVSSKDLSNTLADLENTSYRRIFMGSSYHQLVHLMKLLIVTGNALLFRDPVDFTTHAYSLRQYALLRNGAGQVQDIVLKERVSYSDLPPVVQNMFPGREEHDQLWLWTRIKREPRQLTDVFVVSQQVETYDVGTPSEFPELICPYIPVVWNLVTGENYGRGLIEDFAGDFAKISELSQALALYEIEACKVLHLVAPGSGSDIDQMQGAESGEWVMGGKDDVNAYEAGDSNKIKTILEDINTVYQRLAPAFMYSGNVRDAERVTAEEIRQNAQEAEISLGGIYSALADTLHVPLAHVLVNEVNPDFIAEVISGGISLDILTGVAALGRSTTITRLLEAANDISLLTQVFSQASKRFDMEAIIDLVLVGRGVRLEDVMKTEDQLRQEEADLAQQTIMGSQLAGVAGGGTSVPEQLQAQGIV